MEEKMMKSNGAGSRSSAMKRRRLFSAAAVLLAVCLVFVGAAGAAIEEGDVAIIGTEGYPSIQDAIDAAQTGDRILVIESHELDCTKIRQVPGASSKDDVLICVADKDITIDLNGKIVTADYSNDNWEKGSKIDSVIGVASGAKLTLTDRSVSKTGTLRVNTPVENQNTDKVTYMLINHNANIKNDNEENVYSLIIDGGNYIFDYAHYGSGSSSMVYSVGDETILVKGGNFRLGNLGTKPEPNGNGAPWIFNAASGSGGSTQNIVVEGGTFNADIVHQYYLFEVSVPKEKALVKDPTTNIWTMVNAVAYVNEEAKTDKWHTNEVGYATVEEAVSKLGQHNADVYNGIIKGGSITLLEDADIKKTLEFKDLLENTVFDMGGHKLIWKGNANNGILTVSGNYGLKINSFDIEWEGHEIKMWKKDDVNCETLPENGASSVDVSQSLSVADSAVNKYTIKFDTNGGSAVGDITLDYGTEIDAPANPTKTGYTFRDWNPEIPATMPAKDMTVIAQWVANTSTVTFDADEGTVSEPTKEVTFDQPYGTLPIPTREGHDFVGWYLDDTLITENIKVTVDEDHTLTAHWEKIEIPGDIPEEEEIITPPSSGGGGDGGALSFPRFTENGGLVDFGSSKVVKAVLLPEGSRGSVLLKVDTIEKWPKAVETEYPFDISVEKLGDGMAYILFEIPVSTLDRLGITPADIGVYHLVDEVWVKLAVTYEVKDGMVCYEAETDSFSPFKLVIEEGAAVPKEEETVPVIPPTETPDVPDEPEILPPIDEPTKPADEPETPAPILAVLAGLGAAVIVRRK